jgi:hypothetical protein
MGVGVSPEATFSEICGEDYAFGPFSDNTFADMCPDEFGDGSSSTAATNNDPAAAVETSALTPAAKEEGLGGVSTTSPTAGAVETAGAGAAGAAGAAASVKQVTLADGTHVPTPPALTVESKLTIFGYCADNFPEEAFNTALAASIGSMSDALRALDLPANGPGSLKVHLLPPGPTEISPCNTNHSPQGVVAVEFAIETPSAAVQESVATELQQPPNGFTVDLMFSLCRIVAEDGGKCPSGFDMPIELLIPPAIGTVGGGNGGGGDNAEGSSGGGDSAEGGSGGDSAEGGSGGGDSAEGGSGGGDSAEGGSGGDNTDTSDKFSGGKAADAGASLDDDYVGEAPPQRRLRGRSRGQQN